MDRAGFCRAVGKGHARATKKIEDKKQLIDNLQQQINDLKASGATAVIMSTIEQLSSRHQFAYLSLY